MSFESTVRATNGLESCYRAGLQALKRTDAARVAFENTRHIEGSVDLDACTKVQFPQSSRWDYMIGYRERIVMLEVHPAVTSEVNTVIAKRKWAEDFLVNASGTLSTLGRKYYWASTGGIHILPSSPQAKRLAKSGIQFPRKVVFIS